MPDLQKRAEDERIAAELRALENEALKKQIAAMESEKGELEAKAHASNALASDLQMLKSKVEELQKPWWKRWFTAAD